MGVYDEYNEIQLKVGECVLRNYEIGDAVEISDGVYVAPDGTVIIKDGKLLTTFEKDQVWDKWGVSIVVTV